MQNSDKYILVLGSKPNSIIPNIEVNYVYAANGAAEIAENYKKNFKNTKIVSVVTAAEFERNYEVQKRVINSKPDILVSRFGKINIDKYNFEEKIDYNNLSNLEQFKIQSKFFKNGIFDLIFNESFYEERFFYKFHHIYKSFRQNRFVGVSTGFFSVLYALLVHKEQKVIISGIGMSGGGHYYNQKSDRYTKRSIVDRKLVLKLKKYYKNRLITTDKELSINGNIQLWSNEI